MPTTSAPIASSTIARNAVSAWSPSGDSSEPTSVGQRVRRRGDRRVVLRRAAVREVVAPDQGVERVVVQERVAEEREHGRGDDERGQRVRPRPAGECHGRGNASGPARTASPDSLQRSWQTSAWSERSRLAPAGLRLTRDRAALQDLAAVAEADRVPVAAGEARRPTPFSVRLPLSRTRLRTRVTRRPALSLNDDDERRLARARLRFGTRTLILNVRLPWARPSATAALAPRRAGAGAAGAARLPGALLARALRLGRAGRRPARPRRPRRCSGRRRARGRCRPSRCSRCAAWPTRCRRRSG